jgi:hypothetical protein
MEKLTLQQFIQLIDQPNQDGCLRFYADHKDRMESALGSFIKHQSVPGGYISHLEESMSIGKVVYEALLTIRPVTFSLSDVYLCLFWHDAEKIFKYTEPKMKFESEHQKFTFILGMMRDYGIIITDDIKNAILYVHGEGDMYSSFENIQKPLATFVHCCDTMSARIWSDFPKK